MHATFRIGKTGVVGEILSESQGSYAVAFEDMTAVMPRSLYVAPAEGPRGTFSEAVAGALMPLLKHGKPYPLAEATSLTGFETGPQASVLLNGRHRQEMSHLFSAFPSLGESLAVSSHHAHLQELGWPRPSLGASETLLRRIPVCMKRDPFRDATLVFEGTDVTLKGYYQGAIILEADGEDLYLLVDPQVIHEVKDDYYLALDSGPIPTYDQSKASQLETHFETPLEDIQEGFGALTAYYDYPPAYPEIHGLNAVPSQLVAELVDEQADPEDLFTEEASYKAFLSAMSGPLQEQFGMHPDEDLLRGLYYQARRGSSLGA